jgi:type II secretory pathway component PulJ
MKKPRLRILYFNHRAAGAGLRLGEGSPGDFVAGTLRVPKLRHSESAGYEDRASPQAAFTLLEMVLALSLFLGAVTVLAQIVWNGQRAATQARLRTEAAFRCESKLAEILSGAEMFQPQQNISFADDPRWTWSSLIAAGQYPELLHLKVIVQHRGGNPAANAEFSLERWMRDPAVLQSAAAAQSQSKVTTQTSSTTAPTPTSGSSSSTSSTGGTKK